MEEMHSALLLVFQKQPCDGVEATSVNCWAPSLWPFELGYFGIQLHKN